MNQLIKLHPVESMCNDLQQQYQQRIYNRLLIWKDQEIRFIFRQAFHYNLKIKFN